MTKIVKGKDYEIIFNSDDIEIIAKNLPNNDDLFPIREPITTKDGSTSLNNSTSLNGLIDVSRYFPKNGNASYSNDVFCLK
jgi:hypothetical protein